VDELLQPDSIRDSGVPVACPDYQPRGARLEAAARMCA
jgi:hypothetical protein